MVLWDRTDSGDLGLHLGMGGIPLDSPTYPTWYSAWDRMDNEIQTCTWVYYKWDSIVQSHLSYMDTGDGGHL